MLLKGWWALTCTLVGPDSTTISHQSLPPLGKGLFNPVSCFLLFFSGVHWLNAFSLQRQQEIPFSVRLRNPRSQRKSFVFEGRKTDSLSHFLQWWWRGFILHCLKHLWSYCSAALMAPWCWATLTDYYRLHSQTHRHTQTQGWESLAEKGWINQLTGPVTLTLNMLMCMCV